MQWMLHSCCMRYDGNNITYREYNPILCFVKEVVYTYIQWGICSIHRHTTFSSSLYFSVVRSVTPQFYRKGTCRNLVCASRTKHITLVFCRCIACYILLAVIIGDTKYDTRLLNDIIHTWGVTPRGVVLTNIHIAINTMTRGKFCREMLYF